MQKLVEFVEFNTKMIVDKPEEVSVKAISGEETETVVIEVRVAKDDLGKLIGKKGKNVGSIRTLLTAVSVKMKLRANLSVIE